MIWIYLNLYLYLSLFFLDSSLICLLFYLLYGCFMYVYYSLWNLSHCYLDLILMKSNIIIVFHLIIILQCYLNLLWIVLVIYDLLVTFHFNWNFIHFSLGYILLHFLCIIFPLLIFLIINYQNLFQIFHSIH